MARNFRELEAKMSPERRAAIQIRAEQQIQQIALDDLLESSRLAQRKLAHRLGATKTSRFGWPAEED